MSIFLSLCWLIVNGHNEPSSRTAGRAAYKVATVTSNEKDDLLLDRVIRSDQKHFYTAVQDRLNEEFFAAVSRNNRRALLAPQAPPKPLPALNGTATLYQLDKLADCESGRNPNKNTGNGFYNAFQYVKSTWDSLVKAIGRPDLIGHYFPDYETQRWVTQHINLRAWPNQFPGCTKQLRHDGVI